MLDIFLAVYKCVYLNIKVGVRPIQSQAKSESTHFGFMDTNTIQQVKLVKYINERNKIK